MGLDQYFYRTGQQYPDKELAYFRKVNFLNRAVESLIGREVENCERVTLTREQMEEICKRITKVLKNPERAESLLPTQERFFFGSMRYDEMYFNDLKHVRREFAQILDGNADATFDYAPDW